MSSFKSWAIDTGEDGFIGRYYFGYPRDWDDGCEIALFKTRRDAQGRLKGMKTGYIQFPKAKVVRVSVEIKVGAGR